MSALILRNHSHNNITIVENDFIDHYMVSANGEYVKVYLLLLRYQNIPDQLPAIPQMADLLENTEGDILRALKYWEKKGFFLSNITKQTNLPESVSADLLQGKLLQKQLFIRLLHSRFLFTKNLRSGKITEMPLFQIRLRSESFLQQDVLLLQEEN